MDRLEFAIRRYQQIVPHPVGAWEDFPIGRIKVWLTDDVCPIVEGYCKRPAFKDQATWPLRNLVAGAGVPERQLVEAVDVGMVHAAQALLELVRQKRVHRRMVALNPPKEIVTEEAFKVTGSGKSRTHIKRALVDTLPIEINQITLIAERFWTDLVCAEDYFEPRSGWMSRIAPTVQPAEFIVALNSELHPIGDFVTRATMRRVEGIVELLATFHRKCLQAAGQAGATRSSNLIDEREVWAELNVRLTALKKTCLTGPDACLRDSCIILTQTYAAFDRAPELAWLGLREAIVECDVPLLRHRLINARNPEMIDRIAAALGDLRLLYPNDSAQQSAIEEAVASGGLVLVNQGRQVYWETHCIDQAWQRHTMPWKLLWQLGSKALHAAAVKEQDLDLPSGALSKLATTVNRLKNLLPLNLRQRIQPIRGERSYCLRLEQHRIHLF